MGTSVRICKIKVGVCSAKMSYDSEGVKEKRKKITFSNRVCVNKKVIFNTNLKKTKGPI